jgi:hypothetical protein
VGRDNGSHGAKGSVARWMVRGQSGGAGRGSHGAKGSAAGPMPGQRRVGLGRRPRTGAWGSAARWMVPAQSGGTGRGSHGAKGSAAGPMPGRRRVGVGAAAASRCMDLSPFRSSAKVPLADFLPCWRYWRASWRTRRQCRARCAWAARREYRGHGGARQENPPQPDRTGSRRRARGELKFACARAGLKAGGNLGMSCPPASKEAFNTEVRRTTEDYGERVPPDQRWEVRALRAPPFLRV